MRYFNLYGAKYSVTGDERIIADHLKDSRTLLYQLEETNENNLDIVSRSFSYEDGTTIFCMISHGQKSVKITAPYLPVKKEEVPIEVPPIQKQEYIAIPMLLMFQSPAKDNDSIPVGWAVFYNGSFNDDNFLLNYNDKYPGGIDTALLNILLAERFNSSPMDTATLLADILVGNTNIVCDEGWEVLGGEQLKICLPPYPVEKDTTTYGVDDFNDMNAGIHDGCAEAESGYMGFIKTSLWERDDTYYGEKRYEKIYYREGTYYDNVKTFLSTTIKPFIRQRGYTYNKYNEWWLPTSPSSDDCDSFLSDHPHYYQMTGSHWNTQYGADESTMELLYGWYDSSTNFSKWSYTDRLCNSSSNRVPSAERYAYIEAREFQEYNNFEKEDVPWYFDNDSSAYIMPTERENQVDYGNGFYGVKIYYKTNSSSRFITEDQGEWSYNSTDTSYTVSNNGKFFEYSYNVVFKLTDDSEFYFSGFAIGQDFEEPGKAWSEVVSGGLIFYNNSNNQFSSKLLTIPFEQQWYGNYEQSSDLTDIWGDLTIESEKYYFRLLGLEDYPDRAVAKFFKLR